MSGYVREMDGSITRGETHERKHPLQPHFGCSTTGDFCQKSYLANIAEIHAAVVQMTLLTQDG